MQLRPGTLISDVCSSCYEAYVEPGETLCWECQASEEEEALDTLVAALEGVRVCTVCAAAPAGVGDDLCDDCREARLTEMRQQYPCRGCDDGIGINDGLCDDCYDRKENGR